MNGPLVYLDHVPHAILRETDDWGFRVYDLASPPRRLTGIHEDIPGPVRTNIDPYQTQDCPSPAALLAAQLIEVDTWSAMSKRSLARFEAFFLVAEDPQRRLEAREVITLAHQVSLVRHILDNPGRRRVLIGDEVGLGKTVEAGLIIKELSAANSGLRVLYLAPARLVSNVGREFDRLGLGFRQWKARDGDARLETDSRIIASIHRAVHPSNFERMRRQRAWDVIVVDECHHLSDWAEGGGDAVKKYQLVRDLVAAQSPESFLLLLSGTPHQAHAARFQNLLRLLHQDGEAPAEVAGRVIYRTKEDVRDWNGNPLFPKRQVNPPLVVDLDPRHRQWLAAIHEYFQPSPTPGNPAIQRAAGWKCAQALQWATSSPNAGLGYLVRQALRADWVLEDDPLSEAIEALRPYRLGSATEPVVDLYRRLLAEIRRQADDDDIEDIEEDGSRSEDVDHAALAELIRQGIDLVRSPRQLKWERLYEDLIQPAGREKFVLFAQPIETVLGLAGWLQDRTGISPAVILGGQSEAERDRQIARFRDPAGSQFLISSRAGGEGINLQWARRLVHLDVPWNPMDMEQRVGRVHRFGSRSTILVDTIVVQDSRETEAWNIARDRLIAVASTLVAPDRFDAVFSRVMCLIPPEELQAILIHDPAVPLMDEDIQRLSALVDSGFRDWKAFHERYAENQRQIRELSAGLASWQHLKDFLIHHGNAEPASGVTQTRFVVSGDEVEPISETADVLRLKDGSKCFVGDFENGLFHGPSADSVGPLGLNIPPVAELLRSVACPSLATGAAYLRWGDNQRSLRDRVGREVVILALARQIVRIDSIGGNRESGVELRAFAVGASETIELGDGEREALFSMSRMATVRVRPVESPLIDRALAEEERLIDELRRPTEAAVREGLRYAIWPVLAVHLSP